MNHPREIFLDVPFDLVGMSELREAVFESAKQPFSFLVTPNVLHIVRADNNPLLMNALKNAEYSVCDSQILRMLASLRGISLELVRGSDFVKFLFDNANEAGGEHILFGIIGSSNQQVEQLRQKYGLSIGAHHVPPMGFINMPDEMTKAAEFIRNHPLDVWILAVGMPQQEILAQTVAQVGGCNGIALCVGASLDFLSGVEKRAPQWVASAGLEWLWRLLEDPRGKWRRYLVESPRVFWLFFRDIVKPRGKTKNEPGESE